MDSSENSDEANGNFGDRAALAARAHVKPAHPTEGLSQAQTEKHVRWTGYTVRRWLTPGYYGRRFDGTA